MSRQRSKPGVLLLGVASLGLAVVLGVAALIAYEATTRQGTDPIPVVSLAADKSLGVNIDLSRLDARSREQVLAAMDAAGLRWVRQRIPWDAIELQRGSLEWGPWDEVVEAVAGHDGLRLIAVLDGSPAWAQAPLDAALSTENPLAPPQEARDFGDWAAALAERYGDYIDHYQIWDEPNIAPHWGAREIDPVGYARLLREGAIRIRATDPGAVILAAALAPNVEPGGANMSDVGFLQALYDHGAAEWFDVVAVQPYDFGQALDAPADPAALNWQRPVLLREVMAAYGDEAKAVWAVSAGLFGGTGQTLQEVIPRAVEQARQDWPWLGPLLWASWSPADRHGEYALTDDEGQLLPTYGVLQELAQADPVAWPGAYPADHASGSYAGQWRVTPLGADLGASGDRLSIRFRGSRLDLTVRRGDYRAFLFVTVDGQPANALPRDADGRAYVVLYDPRQQSDAITLARGLAPGDHVAEIIAERGWGQWAIGGWSVAWQEATLPVWLPSILALMAGGALLFSLSLAWRQRRWLLAGLDSVLARAGALDEGLMLAGAAVLALGFYITPGAVLSLAILALLALILFLNPGVGLLLAAVSLPFYQVGKPLLGKVFSMFEILILVTAVAWACRALLASPRRGWGGGLRLWWKKLKSADWAVLALVAVAAFSLLWAEEGRVAAREFRTVVLESAVFYGLLRAMVRQRWQTWRVVDAWVLGGTLIAVVGVGQWALGQGLITADGVWRVRGFYGSPNNLALYLGRLLPLAIAILAWGQRDGRGGQRRWFYGVAAAVMIAALFLTYSRGAWIVGVPVSLLFLAAMRGRRTFGLAAAALILVAVVLVLLVGPGRLTSLLDASQGTTFFRLQLWRSSLAMIGDHPLLGVGLDNFLYQYRSHYVLPDAWEEFNLSHPHNLIFDFWLRLGLAGLAVLLWLLVAFFREGWRLYAGLPEGNERLLALGLMAGMVNSVAHGLVDNAFFLVDLASVTMLMLALVNNLGSEAMRRST